MDEQLREACEDGSAADVKRLLAAGADPHARSNAGMQALHLAAYCGEDPECKIKALISAGANPDSRTYVIHIPDGGTAGEQTPLHLAVRREALHKSPKGCAVIQALLNGGANPQIVDSAGMTPTDLARALNCNHLVGPHCLPPTP